jgi:hypothetical protein
MKMKGLGQIGHHRDRGIIMRTAVRQRDHYQNRGTIKGTASNYKDRMPLLIIKEVQGDHHHMSALISRTEKLWTVS